MGLQRGLSYETTPLSNSRARHHDASPDIVPTTAGADEPLLLKTRGYFSSTKRNAGKLLD